MIDDKILREQLKQLLDGRNAHMSFDDAVADFPLELINTRPPNVPYTFWHLVEHLRIAQWDILDFCRNPDYQHIEWPAGYWPAPGAEATAEDWQHTVESFRADKAQLLALIEDPAVDLLADLPHAPGYSLLREINVVADHNAYHVGELGILRQIMNAWPAG
jgi:hypothetical protein